MITGIAHVCFTVRSMDASLTFYREGLAMTEAMRRQNEPMNR
ncbi:MAG TPA: VOC family protein [Planctomycetota bacterium]|nr:VOC family protein [Planctomycetota bacterium]